MTRLTRLDLPTFGRPTTATTGTGVSSSLAVSTKSVMSNSLMYYSRYSAPRAQDACREDGRKCAPFQERLRERSFGAPLGAPDHGKQPRGVLLCSLSERGCPPRARAAGLLGSGDGAAGRVGEPDDEGDDLSQVQTGGVELGGVGGLSQRRGLAAGVEGVAAGQVGLGADHIGATYFLASARGAGLGGGGQEQLHRRLGGD